MKLLRITRQIHRKAVEQRATLIHRQYNRDWGTSYSRSPIDPYLTPPPLLQNPGGATGAGIASRGKNDLIHNISVTRVERQKSVLCCMWSSRWKPFAGNRPYVNDANDELPQCNVYCMRHSENTLRLVQFRSQIPFSYKIHFFLGGAKPPLICQKSNKLASFYVSRILRWRRSPTRHGRAKLDKYRLCYMRTTNRNNRAFDVLRRRLT